MFLFSGARAAQLVLVMLLPPSCVMVDMSFHTSIFSESNTLGMSLLYDLSAAFSAREPKITRSGILMYKNCIASNFSNAWTFLSK